MFPHIEDEQRRRAMGNRRVGIMIGRDFQLSVLEVQCRPAAGKLFTQAQDWEANFNPQNKTDGKKVIRLREDDPNTCVIISWEFN